MDSVEKWVISVYVIKNRKFRESDPNCPLATFTRMINFIKSNNNKIIMYSKHILSVVADSVRVSCI